MLSDYGVDKELRSTRTFLSQLIIPEKLREIRMLCGNSDYRGPRLTDVFAFSIAIGDAKNTKILRDKCKKPIKIETYIMYRDLIKNQIRNNRKETVKSILNMDPFKCNNYYETMYGSFLYGTLLDDIHLEPISFFRLDEKKVYLDLLAKCGCVTYGEARKLS